jgi:hypothetical protein
MTTPTLALNIIICSRYPPKDPLYLSINIQSLLSKHEQLLQFIQELEKSDVTIEVIAVQEIWDVQYANLVNLPGFKPLIYKKRKNMRGGGVGFHIRNYLNYTVIENLSPFEKKIFESITIELSYPSLKKLFCLPVHIDPTVYYPMLRKPSKWNNSSKSLETLYLTFKRAIRNLIFSWMLTSISLTWIYRTRQII